LLLQRLDVAKCSNVSCVGITALTENTVQLQQLNLSYCKKVSKSVNITYMGYRILSTVGGCFCGLPTYFELWNLRAVFGDR
jgi:F-box/leucine-rich repeat protein 2/20